MKQCNSRNYEWNAAGAIAFDVSLTALILLLFYTFMSHAYGESDFVLEMNNASTTNEILTLFAIEGESYKEICPSGQCRLDDQKIDPFFGPPTPENMGISFNFDFTLKDIISNPNVGPLKKEYLEKFFVSMGCKLDDIIEDGGQEIYTCHDESTTVTRKFDFRSWHYDTIAIFDAKKNTLKAVGNYTGSR